MTTIHIDAPSERQREFLADTHRYVAYGGARGGGKSWAVRTKAVLLALNYPGIRILIVRRTYRELINNHVEPLRPMLSGIADYNKTEKVFLFVNGSTVWFGYCAAEEDLLQYQGAEYDVIFIDEATQLKEDWIRKLNLAVRGANSFPKRTYFTMNPGGVSHGYFKRLFIDRRFESGEDADEYSFIPALVTDNHALMKAQPGYKRELERLPPKLRAAWLYGDWNIFQGQFFEDFIIDPPQDKADELGMTREELKKQGRFCHVIEPIDLAAGERRGWRIFRSYDFGYARPFSCAWWAVDYDGTLYRVLELYGSAGGSNEGCRWTPQEQFERIAEIENTHPWLKGKYIDGVADPSIWDTSRGESVAEAAMKRGLYFTPGDNKRVAGWMQCHYRLRFDERGFPGMYVFDNCAAFIRTVPMLRYSDSNPEDLDTSMEDHAADEWRYACMSRPIEPARARVEKVMMIDPLK